MNRKELKKMVFTMSLGGRLITIIECSLLMGIISFLFIRGIEFLVIQKPTPDTIFLRMAVPIIGTLYGLLIGLKIRSPFFIWMCCPINKKGALRYCHLEEIHTKQKIEENNQIIGQVHEKQQIMVITQLQENEKLQLYLQELKNLKISITK